MRLYYFKDREGNFGDDLNPWLWQQLFPNFFNATDKELFVGVGTLLNHRIPAAPAVTVFGSGHGYGELPHVNSDWKFYCVRGPLTAKTLELPAELAITDPASLAARFHTKPVPKQHKISYIPHCDSARLGDWARVCAHVDINYIDPRKPFLQVVEAIRQSELLLTEAMHGAILADSFRVPWISVKAYPHICEYKWQDWLMSVELNAQFKQLPPIWQGDVFSPPSVRLKNRIKRVLINTPLWRLTWTSPPEHASTEQHIAFVANKLIEIANNTAPQLSKQSVLDENTEKLMTTAQQFSKDFGI